MHFTKESLIFVALSFHAVATPIANAATASDRICWNAYQEKNFTGSPKPVCGQATTCHVLPDGPLTNNLWSAFVYTPHYVFLYTDKKCQNGWQYIDINGYRNMGNLPAYHSWDGFSNEV